MIDGTPYRLGEYWQVPAADYLWLRLVQARRITAQVVDAYLDHMRRLLDDAERQAKDAARQGGSGGGGGDDWG